MAQRLPIPGSDDNTWGDILNGFLEVSLNSDGTLQNAAVSQAGGEVQSNKGAPSGYAPLNSSSLVPTTNLATGTANNTTFLRGDQTWAMVAGGGSGTLSGDSDVTITSPTNGQVLTYNTGATKWENISPAVASVFGRTGAVIATSGDYTAAQVTGALVNTNNLSDVSSVSTARTNLGLGTAATQAIATFLQSANNLSDVASAATARTNLGLGSSATQSSSTYLQVANNLSDLNSASTARTNLGLGTAATISSTAGGDLSGTLPSPTVAKVNGVSISGTPSSGQVITATSGTAADWATPSGGTVSSSGTSGAPTSGTWATGAMALATTGYIWLCITGGTPGSWEGPFVPASTSLSVVTTTNGGKTGSSADYGTNQLFFINSAETYALPTPVGAGYQVISVTNGSAVSGVGGTLTVTTGNTDSVTSITLVTGSSVTFYSDSTNWQVYSQAVGSVVSTSQVGAANGVASLDGTGNVPFSELANAPGGNGQIQSYTYSGVLATGIQAPRLGFTKAHTVLGISATVNTAPSGSSLIIDVLKNGTTVYGTNTGNKPTIVSGAFVSSNEVSPTVTTNGETIPDTTAIAVGDYFQIDVTQVGSSTAGSDLVLVIRYV